MTERTLTDLDFDSFGLHPSLSQGLHQAGFTRLTPIQALTLPETLQHHDVAGQAQTGTGKTAAFLVTLMQRLLSTEAKPDRRIQDPRSVILAPTRELAIQIHKDAMQLGGVYVVGRSGEVLYRYASEAAGDHPPVEAMLAALPG